MYYQVMPDLSDDEYRELKADIAERGVQVPIEFDEGGNILDGHHRLKACRELGLTDYPTITRYGMTEAEKHTHARKLNMLRRHLTQEQRRELVRAQLVETPKMSDRQIAAMMGISNKTVSVIRAELVEAGQVCNLHTSTGSDGKEYPRQPRRKPVTVYNQTPREERAMRNPAVVEKLVDGTAKSVADAQREVKREEIITRLEDVGQREVKAAQGLYDVIVIDPPWLMKKIERDVSPDQVEFDYPTMTEEDLAALEIPAAADCHVWLWTTHKFLPMALRLLDVWGLKYVCTFVWHKPGGFQPFGLPQYNCEFALYARKGSPAFIDTQEFPVCFDARRVGHSVKPEAFMAVVKRVTAGRRLEMFARNMCYGFDSWGNEVDWE